MIDPNDRSKINLGGGTVSPTVQVEIMPTGVMCPSTLAQVAKVSEKAQDGPLPLFRRCFEMPLQVLRRLPNGDGGFVAMIIACPLYERYVANVRRSVVERCLPPGLGACCEHSDGRQLIGRHPHHDDVASARSNGT